MTIEQTAEMVAERDVSCVLPDGTVLRADVFRPATSAPVPALLHRTPYSKALVWEHHPFDIPRAVAAGYAVVVQDVRGRYASEGDFSPSVNEAADGAATIAWLAAAEWCDGLVGMWGSSYTAEVQWSAKTAGAPALRSIAPALSPAHSSFDGFRFRGGAREFGSMIGWALGASEDRIERLTGTERDAAARAHREVVAAYGDESLFRLGSWSLVPEGDPMVDWMLRQLAEPYDSPAHDLNKMVGRYDAVDVPALLIGGWYDVFLGSTLAHYRVLSERADAGLGPAPRLLIGPWSHMNGSGSIGDMQFGSASSFDDIGGTGDFTDWHLSWFDETLRSAEDTLPAAFAFDTGSHRWHGFDSFPPASTPEPWFLDDRGALQRTPPQSAGRVDFVADPADPVPTIGGATLLGPANPPGPFDQRPLYGRADVVSFRSVALDADVSIGGLVRAAVSFSTSGEDADLVVRVCDERPDGLSVPVCDGVLRLSATGIDPESGRGTITPPQIGTASEYLVDLWAAVHTFREGHRIRVDLTWGSSPRWDVNRHVLADPFARIVPRPATHTIHTGGPSSSRIILPIL